MADAQSLTLEWMYALTSFAVSSGDSSGELVRDVASLPFVTTNRYALNFVVARRSILNQGFSTAMSSIWLTTSLSTILACLWRSPVPCLLLLAG